MFKLGHETTFTTVPDMDAVNHSVHVCNRAIKDYHDALAPKCGKSLSINFDSDPFYGECRYLEICATGKDMISHVYPLLLDEDMLDKGEEWWEHDFGQSLPILKPRKKYHLLVNIACGYFMLRERCVVNGVVAF